MSPRFAISVILGACSGSSSPPAAPAPGPQVDPPKAPPAELVVVPPKPAEDAIPPELAGAPARVFRYYKTGMARTKGAPAHDIQTWTLRRHADAVLLVVDRSSSEDVEISASTKWKAGATTQYRGSASGGTLALASGPNQMELECKDGKLEVADARATRKPHPAASKYRAPCSGDPGRWVPAATKKIDVLNCFHPDFASPMAFAAEPGVEYVYVDDDCNQQGGGYRAIGSDRAIAPSGSGSQR